MEIVGLSAERLEDIRRIQAAGLHGPSQLYTDARVAAPDAIHLGLVVGDTVRGYASFSSAGALMEIFVAPPFRPLALTFWQQSCARVAATEWEINSYDRFALSLAWNAGCTLHDFSAYLFSFDAPMAAMPPGYTLRRATAADLAAMKPVLRENDFYTVDWGRLEPEVAEGTWFVALDRQGSLVGAGYNEPVTRTPQFADVGMVVTAHRREGGIGAGIAAGAAAICLEQGLTPVAVCAAENQSARRALERGGFYADGRIWRVRL